MIDPSTTERGHTRAVPTWFVLGLVGIAAVLAYIALWRGVDRPGSFFGGDLIAYISAADRLAATGSPYSPQLFLGPVENRIENVPIGYFYPPILAQLLLPLRGIPPLALAAAWSTAQMACLLVLLPRLAAGRSAPTLNRSLLAIGFGLASYPLQFALFGGNVSGWLAIGVALSLTSGPRARGFVAAVAAAIKLVPIPMLAAAFTDRRTRLAAIFPLAIVVGVSVLLAPPAWTDFVQILPNVLRNVMADDRTNLSPAGALSAFGLVGVGTIVGWVLAIAFGIAALVTGFREGYSHRVVAIATLSLTFASSTLWDHYLGVMVPLILWAWPLAGTQRRRAIAAFVVLLTGLWVRLDATPEYRLALVASLVACSLAIATTRDQPCGDFEPALNLVTSRS